MPPILPKNALYFALLYVYVNRIIGHFTITVPLSTLLSRVSVCWLIVKDYPRLAGKTALKALHTPNALNTPNTSAVPGF